MAANKRVKTPKAAISTTIASRTDPAVAAFLRRLDHPLKPVLEAVRTNILGANPGIGEGIKWNSPSFHFKEYFATAGLRPGEGFVRVVFHKGAKTKDNAGAGMKIADPAGLLQWHARERCSMKLVNMKDVTAKSAALKNIVRQWIKQM